ncbi:MAG TPA: class II aldolase/adducin family protein [Alphaproteobacteria bacterium]|nr:class II aldolase/adducin family protein [Alphaproteobacteria bacterium]
MPLDALAPLETPSVKNEVSPEEWEIRVELAALYRLAAKFDYTDLGGTHFSARVPGPYDHFLINPFGLLFEEICASNLVKLDVDGNILVDAGGHGVNAAGFTIHSAVHMARHDLVCVAHTHTVAGMAVSCLKDGVLPLTQHVLRFYSRLSYHDYEGPATNLDERERLVADLGQNNNMVLRNHGLMCGGRSVPETWRNLFALEKSCEAQLQAMALSNATGRPLKFVSQEVAQATSDKVERRSGKETVSRDWPTQLRRLDFEEPDYKL